MAAVIVCVCERLWTRITTFKMTDAPRARQQWVDPKDVVPIRVKSGPRGASPLGPPPGGGLPTPGAAVTPIVELHYGSSQSVLHR
jgi:hypothetical protein